MNQLGPIVMFPLGAVYGAITRARLNLYRRGTFRTETLAAPVISVGNITAGGTGKTPLVEWVCRVLAGQGKKVCILTRGYGRANPRERVLVSDGTDVFPDAQEAGDEAMVLAHRLLGKAAVISDANRVSAGQGALSHLGSNCFVLDDGFQHLRLARDLDIVTIDATNPWGGGHLLPYGRLREPLSGLSRASCTVITRVDQAGDIEKTTSKLRDLTNGRPIFLSRMRTIGTEPIHPGREELEKAQPCLAFCGVGNPSSFFRQVKAAGYEIVAQKAFADHHFYTQTEIDKLEQIARQSGAECLITTEKDAVKLRSLQFSLPCRALKIEIAIENSAELERLIIDAAQ